MKIAILQIDSAVGDFASVVDRMCDQATLAAAQGAELAIFPFTVLTGPHTGGLIGSEGFLVDVTHAIVQLVERLPIAALVPMSLNMPGFVGAEVLLIRDGSVFPLRAEAMETALTAGVEIEDAPMIFSANDIDFGVVVDPESLELFCQGETSVDVIIYLSTLSCNTNDEATMLAPAVADGVFTQDASAANAWFVAVGSIGGYGEQVFAGGSFVMAPWGELACVAPSFEEALVCCDINPLFEGPMSVRISAPSYQRIPFLWSSLQLAVRDLVEKVGAGGVYCVLTGDMQTSTLAALLVDALGPTRVRALIAAQDEAAREDCRFLTHNLRIEATDITTSSKTLDTARSVAVSGALGSSPTVNGNKLAEIIAYTLSQEQGWLPMGAADKTGLALEPWREQIACTYLPFGDVYRTDIELLGRHRTSISPVIPRRALQRIILPDVVPEGVPPAAPAALLNGIDAILLLYIERRMGLTTISEDQHQPELVSAIIDRVQTTELWRRGAPAYPVVSDRSLAECDWPLANAWHDSMHQKEELAQEQVVLSEPDVLPWRQGAQQALPIAPGSMADLIALLRELGLGGLSSTDDLFDFGLFSRN